MEFFFTQSEIIYVTQWSLKRLFHVARNMSSEREVAVACLSFIAEMNSNKDTLGTNKHIADLIIY